MKAAAKKQVKVREKKPIKLRLNYRTVVTVRTEVSLRAWLEKYPEAVVID